jgi:hypothetical protein
MPSTSITKKRNNISDQFQESLGPKQEGTDKMLNFLKQTDLYKLI